MVKILREFFTINGRLNRKKFIIYWVLASCCPLIIMLILCSLEKAISLPQSIGGLIIAVSILAVMTAHICLAVRRLHDVDRHGAMVIALFVPILNIILYFYLLFIKGTEGYNYYGPDPLEGIK